MLLNPAGVKVPYINQATESLTCSRTSTRSIMQLPGTTSLYILCTKQGLMVSGCQGDGCVKKGWEQDWSAATVC